jgi:hypothetical protein
MSGRPCNERCHYKNVVLDILDVVLDALTLTSTSDAARWTSLSLPMTEYDTVKDRQNQLNEYAPAVTFCPNSSITHDWEDPYGLTD